MPLIPPHALARKRRLSSPSTQQWSSEVRLVTIAPAGNPGHFSAEVAGEKIVTSSRTPFCDAARVLLDRRADSNSWLILRHAGSDTDCLRGKVGVIAKITVAEGDRDAPRFRPWRPFLSRRGSPPMHSNGSSLAASEAAP